MTERDIIRRLENSPVPPPPEDLAARIINDIPEEIELHPDLAGEERKFRPFHRRPGWLAAAAAVTVALGGAVTWELQRQRPTDISLAAPQTVFDEREAIEIPATQSVTDTQVSATPAVSGKEEVKKVLGTAAADERTTSAEMATHLEGASGIAVDQESPARKSRQLPSPEPAPAESLGATADPAPAPSNLREERGRIRAYDSAPDRADLSGVDKGLNEHEGHTQDTFLMKQVSGAPAGGVRGSAESKKSKDLGVFVSSSTGDMAEPNDQAYGDVFFEHTGVNPFIDTEDDHLSTFGLDVDTGSYTVVRRYLRDGNLPPQAAIRVEEFVNFFDYGDPAPRRDDFRLTLEGAPSAFAQGDRIHTLRMAVKAREVDAEDRPPAVLVFCVDVSGSMERENRLALVKKALFELLENLRNDDHVGLVVYGSRGQVLLKPTTNREIIIRAINRLQPGGSTNAEEGLSLAYGLLSDGDRDGRLRRVILCSDGVANVGRTGPDSILERIRLEAQDGIELTTVGFGMGNYNDVLMERLADTGNGRYAYVDNLQEAHRIFVEELTGTLFTLGHDAKAQVEFNPEVVSRWRLVGYENRDIADNLFRDPTVDAGEIGAGHNVTALYEVKLQPRASRHAFVATLRYRYRPMNQTRPVEMEKTLRVSDLEKSWEKATPSLRLASLVAEFGEILKGAYWARDGDLEEVLRRLQGLQVEFEDDSRVAELTALVARAADLQGEEAKTDRGRR
ncbi:MAG: von Willebrand factor type A domain-containing protein [Thermoanaerobaculales bacterium]|nr:von Willebrand factor type A domain-containing protein [Thermoanaerobaculales bacterium]